MAVYLAQGMANQRTVRRIGPSPRVDFTVVFVTEVEDTPRTGTALNITADGIAFG